MSDRRLPGADLRARSCAPPSRPPPPPRCWPGQLVPGLLAGRPAAAVVDLGCGRGDSVDVFPAGDPGVRWLGLEGSREYAERTRDDADLRAFDGRTLPCADASVDVVFCSRCSSTSSSPTRS